MHPHSKILVRHLRHKPEYSEKEIQRALEKAKAEKASVITLPRKKGLPYATMIAYKEDGEIRHGWAVCADCDTFSRRKALELAVARAEKNRGREPAQEIAKALPDFQSYAEAFFNRPPRENIA